MSRQAALPGEPLPAFLLDGVPYSILRQMLALGERIRVGKANGVQRATPGGLMSCLERGRSDARDGHIFHQWNS